MRECKFAVFWVVLAATCVWSQQASAPKPDQPAPAPIVRDPHSTKADLAVPLCPATFNDSLETDGIVANGDKTVTPAKVVHSVEAEFSDKARHVKRKEHEADFEARISIVVDTAGNPQTCALPSRRVTVLTQMLPAQFNNIDSIRQPGTASPFRSARRS